MTNHWIDIKNTDAVLIIGSNAAEHHPVAFKWIMRAKDKGAVLMHVDPKFSRTSARCDFHVPLRSGTDIAFLGGMVNYIIQSESYLKDYVLNYTNASFVVGKDYAFEDGLFSGYRIRIHRLLCFCGSFLRNGCTGHFDFLGSCFCGFRLNRHF